MYFAKKQSSFIMNPGTTGPQSSQLPFEVAATPSLKLQGKSGAGGMEKCWPLMTAAIILHDTMVRRQGDGEWFDFCGR